MGDWFQIIVDRDATGEEALALGEAIRDWLIEEGIIGSDMTDNLLGSGLGYPPGPNHRTVADPGIGENLLDGPGVNGMEIITGRTVFYSTFGPTEPACAGCGYRFEFSDEVGDAISAWYARRGPGNIECSKCGTVRSITEWEFNPPWGFGYLGFEFWNWPPFEAFFIEEVSKRLGHRVVLVEGKV